MKIFAIADLHLSSVTPKPMDIFGCEWNGHWPKISAIWTQMVSDEDVVLVPGDISWAMKLTDAIVDLNDISRLPGRKIILRGNHDYWWSSIARVREALPAGMYAIQNDRIELENVSICGSRGWLIAGPESNAEDRKIYEREITRLELSLASANGKEIIAMTHFPPFDESHQSSGFTRLYEKYEVKTAVYGHLHDVGRKAAFEGSMNGTNYSLVSCDHLGFAPKLIAIV